MLFADAAFIVKFRQMLGLDSCGAACVRRGHTRDTARMQEDYRNSHLVWVRGISMPLAKRLCEVSGKNVETKKENTRGKRELANHILRKKKKGMIEGKFHELN